MRIVLTDRVLGEQVETDAYLTRHHVHSNTGAWIMLFETGRELTWAVWKLAKGQIKTASVDERKHFAHWQRQNQQ